MHGPFLQRERREKKRFTDSCMRSSVVLISLTAFVSAVSWWPGCIQPSLDLSFWVPLVCVGLCTALSTILAPKRWPSVLLASGLSTFVGLSACMIWPSSGPPVGGGMLYIASAIAVAMMLVAGAVGFVMRKRSISNESSRRVVWAVIFACVAFGPVTLALAPSMVRHRLESNNRLAAERFASLKKAVESTRAEPNGSSKICDGPTLGHHYAGPPFSQTDWRRITGNYVKQDGYVFMVHCHENEKGGYLVNARPARAYGDGTRQFCTDESGKVGCGMDFRHKCMPCPQ